jgi:DNA (cytosine-5)-methyltransferase 1
MQNMVMPFTFADFFAGIGGFHLAFHALGAECVFASECDEAARKTYIHNFMPLAPSLFAEARYNDDILNLTPEALPDFDILCAGFPCQPFSQAGYKRGFAEDKDARGNMFFVLRDIIRAKRPKALFLENVRHLLHHDEGRTFRIIRHTIEEELGYDFYYQVVKASDYGLPQHRARVYMVGFDRKLGLPCNFHFPPKQKLHTTMSDIFAGECDKDIGFTLRVGGRGSNIDDRRNWEFYRVNGEIRRIGVIEGKKMMGFPDDFHFPVSIVQAMKQLGNSVAVDAVRAVAGNIMAHLRGEDVLTEKPRQLSLHYEGYAHANA